MNEDPNLREVTRTLADVAHTLVALDRPIERIDSVLALLRQIVPYERCALLEIVPSPEHFVLYALPKPSSAEIAPLRGRLVGLLRLMGFEGSAAEGGELLERARSSFG